MLFLAFGVCGMRCTILMLLLTIVPNCMLVGCLQLVSCAAMVAQHIADGDCSGVSEYAAVVAMTVDMLMAVC